MSLRVPLLLEPYLSPDSSSLVLLTGILGANTNWLVLRYLYSYLKGSQSVKTGTAGEDGEEEGEEEGEESRAGVILVSFMRDAAFWKDGCGKSSLDLDMMSRGGRFVFVDGLTRLFAERASPATALSSESHRLVENSGLVTVQKEIELALANLKPKRKVLFLDGLDCLLAASGGEVTSLAIQDMILHLRERVDITLLTLSADDPLLHSQTTSLEKNHSNLVLSIAHSADHVLSLRMLDTGTARDVSGVVRICSEQKGHREYLYYVGSDGGAKVFERGT